MLFRNMVSKWPTVVKAWTKLETNMWGYGYSNLSRVFKTVSGIILGFALVEHSNSVYINIPSLFEDGKNSTGGFFNYLKEYCDNSHYFVFNVLDYNLFLALYVVVISNTATFAWNFQDVFIILMSQGLTTRLNLLNGRIKVSALNQVSLSLQKLRASKHKAVHEPRA